MSSEEDKKASTFNNNFDVVSYEDQILDKIMDELSSDCTSYTFTNVSSSSEQGIDYDSSSIEESTQTPTTISCDSTTTSDHDNNTTPNNSSNNRKKRKYHINNISRNKKYLRIPRIVNSDLRKKYPIMLINVLNSCNYHLMKEFFYYVTDINTSATWNFTRYRPDQKHSNHPEPPSLSSSSLSSSSQICMVEGKNCLIQFQHVSDICNYILHSSLTIPDCTYKIVNCEIFTRSDSFETKIVIDYRMTGTKTYHSNPHTAGLFVQSFSESLRKERKSEKDEESSLVQSFYQNVARIESPRPMLSEGKIILSVENYRESMKINKIVFEATSNQARFRR